jgi:hypothetical protein
VEKGTESMGTSGEDDEEFDSDGTQPRAKKNSFSHNRVINNEYC